jgi:hypothetical protein
MDLKDMRRMLRGFDVPEGGFEELLQKLDAAERRDAAERARVLRRPRAKARPRGSRAA